MTRLRAIVVAATIILSILFSLAALARDRLLWPFSHYPMYSGLYGPSTAITRAAGIDARGQEFALPLSVEPNDLHLHIIVDYLLRQPGAKDRLTRLAAGLGQEYERLSPARRVGGSVVLVGVRIYRDTIQLANEPHVRRTTLVAQTSPP